MKRFLHAHATHPDPHMALALVAAQIEAQRHEPGHASAPTLGWLYLTDHFAGHAQELLADVRHRWPDAQWVGATGVGIAGSGVEYFDEPALSVMLAELPREQFRVFSGAQPLGDFAAHTANVHADPQTSDLDELIHDMSRRTATGYLFGGIASGRSRTVHIADGVLSGGLSGVAFGQGVALVSRVTQGCTPVGPQRQVTAAERNVITELDNRPALECLLSDMKLEGTEPRDALPALRQILVGLTDAPSDSPVAGAVAGALSGGAFDSAVAATSRRDSFAAAVRVRHLIGLDPARRGIAIADIAQPGMQLAFCTRNAQAARRDLMRICAEVREEVESEELPLTSAYSPKKGALVTDTLSEPIGAIAGAIYISCAGRGGAHFGAPSAELAIVRHALGDVPLVGFFASGEIAHAHLYGYTGVLTVFPSNP